MHTPQVLRSHNVLVHLPASTKTAKAMLNVLRMHRSEVSKIDASLVSEDLLNSSAAAWDEQLSWANSTVCATHRPAFWLQPNIGLMMDCDTTGIEPDFSLVKHKNLVGGGLNAIVNQTVPRALRTMGYNKSQVDEIVAYIFEHGIARVLLT